MYLDLFLILCIVSYGVGVSGFFKNFKKPLSCATCMTFWTCIVYLLFTKNFNLEGIALSCLCSFLASPLTDLLLVVREILNWILVKLTPR